MNDLALSTIELFAGVGMLGEGVRAGLAYMGIKNRTVCFVEREAYAASVLVARMEEGSLDEAPVWSDVCTFDARAWHGKVDCIVAGFPCQDLSVAGRRIGLDGKRSGLFFEVIRIATDSGAWGIVLENVAGIASATASVVDQTEGELDERAAARVVGELADCGWDSEWITLSASDVGASHGRARWFCLAWRAADAESIRGRIRQRDEFAGRAEAESAVDQLGDTRLQRGDVQQRDIRTEHSGAGNAVGNPDQQREQQSRQQNGPHAREGARSSIGGSSGPMADTGSSRLQGNELGATRNSNWGGGKHMDQLANFVAYSPLAQATRDGQESSNDSPKSPRHLNPLFGAWLMGWPSTWVIAEPHASSALETALWRSTLQSHLSCLLDEPESLNKEAA